MTIQPKRRGTNWGEGITNALKRRTKRLLRRIGQIADHYESVSKHVFAHHVSTVFRHYDIRCVIDVGANRGGYRDFLRDQVGFNGLIISFEPVRANVEVLNSAAKRDGNWVVYDFALGNENGIREMNVMKQDLFSSFLGPDNSIVSDFKAANILDHTQTVGIRTLDSVIEGLELKCSVNNVYLKMDTQGYDLEVIRGASRILPTLPAMQTELSFQPIYKNMPDFRQVLDFLNAQGFQISALCPITRDSNLRAVETDCVLVNTELSQASSHIARR